MVDVLDKSKWREDCAFVQETLHWRIFHLLIMLHYVLILEPIK